jgi:hypothetical protein
MMDNYTIGWLDADEAIQHNLPGCKDYSQGDTDWDKGWNNRIESQRLEIQKVIGRLHGGAMKGDKVSHG